MKGTFRSRVPGARRNDPADIFLACFAEVCRRSGGRGAQQVLSEIDRLTPARLAATPRTVPVCAFLDPAFRWADGLSEPAEAVLGALAAMRDELHWERPDAAAPAQLRGCIAWAHIVGPGARIPSDRMKLGVFLAAPHTDYPPHRHAADELYLVLSGKALWRKGEDAPAEKAPGSVIRHRPGEIHALCTGAKPLLAVFCWWGRLDGGYELL